MAVTIAPKTKEQHSSDIKIQQKPDLHLPSLDDAFEYEADVMVVAEEQLHKDYAEALAFNEEPVMILIARSNEKFPPKAIEIWVNGKGAEVFDARLIKWVCYGALPVGVKVITKRKYVEVLAGSKVETVSTQVENEHDDPNNLVRRDVSQRASFTVIDDRNHKGAEWFQRLIAFR